MIRLGPCHQPRCTRMAFPHNDLCWEHDEAVVLIDANPQTGVLYHVCLTTSEATIDPRMRVYEHGDGAVA